jgi:hypothetical protein
MESKIVPLERIEKSIYVIRGIRVMIDRDLASLYGVETRALNQAVTRNPERFPRDFMFKLTREEIMRISQSVTSSTLRFSKNVLAFTEQGVAMLSSVLRSPRAIEANIEIMRAFVALRRMLSSHVGLGRKLAELEKKYDAQFQIVFEAIRELMAEPEPVQKKQIGFHVRERRAQYGRSQKAESKI